MIVSSDSGSKMTGAVGEEEEEAEVEAVAGGDSVVKVGEKVLGDIVALGSGWVGCRQRYQ